MPEYFEPSVASSESGIYSRSRFDHLLGRFFVSDNAVSSRFCDVGAGVFRLLGSIL